MPSSRTQSHLARRVSSGHAKPAVSWFDSAAGCQHLLDGPFAHLYNIVVPATNPDESDVRLLRAYLDAVTLSEALQTRIWHAAELTLAQVRVLRRLAKQARSLRPAGGDPALAELPLAQVRVLRSLAKQPRSLGRLGADLVLAPPSMTRLVDRLEERGLIERSRNDDDRRKVLATPTAEGRRLVVA